MADPKTITDPKIDETLRDDTRAAWHRFVDATADFRPELFKYCRSLAATIWDAEDLVQETLLRGFSQLGSLHQPIVNPRGYLVRIASHLWIDQIRRSGREAAHLVATWEAAQDTDMSLPDQHLRAEAGDAVVSLYTHLAPQERAALLLKEVFGFSLEETAHVLSTSIGAIKAALHRARAALKTVDGPATHRSPPSRRTVQAFVDHMNAADMESLLLLMHDEGSVAYHGCLLETSKTEFGNKGSWFDRATHGHMDWPEALRPPRNRNEFGEVESEPVLLGFNDYGDGEILVEILRLDMRHNKIMRLNSYGCCPQVLQEVASAKGFQSGPPFYRFPTPEPGKYWADVSF